MTSVCHWGLTARESVEIEVKLKMNLRILSTVHRLFLLNKTNSLVTNCANICAYSCPGDADAAPNPRTTLGVGRCIHYCAFLSPNKNGLPEEKFV